jgi:hypothetical protein
VIVLWLLPPLLVTLVAMAWVAWLGRAGRGAVDRDEAVRRLGAVLEGRPSRWRRWAPWSRGRTTSRTTPGYAVAPRPRERSTGVAVRRSPRPE